MAFAPPSIFVLNNPMQVAQALRYINANGDLQTQLYPIDYISLIGSTVGNQVGQISTINATLVGNATTLTSLQSQITAIQTSGATAIPEVNGACLNGNTVQPINVITALLVANSCSYNTVLGTTTALSAAILAEGYASLNSALAYSQNSAMAGLAGWVSVPSAVSDAINNLWLAYLDIRVGVTQALNQSAITCADIKINYQGVYNMAAQAVNMYFYGSSIPTAFIGSGSNSGTFTLTDTAGHTYTQDFNLYTAVTNGSVVLNIQNSALLPNSVYTSVLTYALTSTTPNLGCNGGLIQTIVNNTQTCPNLTATALSSSVVQFSFTPTILDNTVYTIDLLNTSGTTSGSTIVQTKTYQNPSAPVTDQFTNLTTQTHYWIRSTVTVSGSSTICPSVPVTTS